MRWIKIEDNPPEVRKMVVFKAFNVPFGTFRDYTSDPWCGWLNGQGSYVRWPHTEFDPTHYCELPE